MRDLIADIFSSQNVPPGTREGLPYWIFWLLLCIILLLLAFIFLRDKDLRQRINNFFFRTKQKLIKLKLQHRLKKEINKKQTSLLNLGQKAWGEKITVPKGEKITEQLKELEQKINAQKKELKECEEKINFLNSAMLEKNRQFDQEIAEQENIKNLDQEKINTLKEEEKKIESQVLSKQKEIENITRQINDLYESLKLKKESGQNGDKTKEIDPKKVEQKISELSEKKNETDNDIKKFVDDKTKLESEQEKFQSKVDEIQQKIDELSEEQKQYTRKYQKEIKEWEKTRNKTEEKIRSLEQDEIPIFESLGKIIDAERIELKELEVFYSQIDRINSKIQELEKQIDDLP